MSDRIKAISILYKAGYASQEKAAEIADKILAPANGEIIFDYAFFSKAPDNIGEALAKILPDSPASKLTLTDHNPVYGYTHTPVRLLRANCNKDFGDRLNLAALFGCLNSTSIKNLSIADAPYGDAAYQALSQSLKETSIETFTACHTDIAASVRNGSFSVVQTGLKKIALPDNDFTGNEAVAIAEQLNRSSVNEVDLSKNKIISPDIVVFFKQMPQTLKVLNLNETNMGSSGNTRAVAAGLAQLIGLTDLHLSGTELNSSSAPALFQAFPKTSLLRIDLSGNNLTDTDGECLAETLSDDRCTIYETKIAEKTTRGKGLFAILPGNQISDPVMEKVKAAEAKNTAKHNVILNQEKARKTYAGFTDSEKFEDSNIFIMAQAGKIKELLQKRPFTAADYARQDKDGKPLLIHIAESKTLDAVFDARQWNSPKKMQELWNTVPAQFKSQLDGKSGHPSFIKNKNQVTAKVVKNSLQIKKGMGK